MFTVQDIRGQFTRLLASGQLTTVGREASMTELMGKSTVEIVNASFIADEEAIFGTPNHDYIKREEEWYASMSLNVNDIPGGAPQVWKAVADPDGFINSNYGWCIYSCENGAKDAAGQLASQYHFVISELFAHPESRRAEMIYTRPTMWSDYKKNGRSDFMCTDAVQYLIRNHAVHALVRMRSNDAVLGFKNDRAWQQHVLEKVTETLNGLRSRSVILRGDPYAVGNLYWNAGSLHVYARHFYLIDPDKYHQEES